MASPKHVTRRDFISYSAFNSLALMLPGTAFALMRTDVSDKLKKYRFSYKNGLGPDINAPIVEQMLCPLHKEEILPQPGPDSQQYQQISSALRAEFEDAGIGWDNNNQIGLTYQHYGVPDNSSVSIELLEYCEHVNEFIYNRLTNLLEVTVDWQRLINGGVHTDYSYKGFRGFVGRYTYYVLRASVHNNTVSFDTPYLVSAWPVDRAINHIVDGENYKPTQGRIYVIPGATSLVAPFSELMHLTLHAASQRYADELTSEMPREHALAMAKIAGETATEAAATLLATEYLQAQNCNEMISTIDRVAESMATQYPSLPWAIEYMKQNGLQRTLNLFQNSPSEFMQRQFNTFS